MLNKLQDTWNYRHSQGFDFPEMHRSVVILVEHDVTYDPSVEVPFTRIAELTQEVMLNGATLYVWKLLDYDPELEEEFLQQYYSVVAWRYLE